MSKKEINEVMSKIKVKSFGTAMNGWPSGPSYEQFFNVFDPVPWLIEAASLAVFYRTFSWDTFKAKRTKHYNFNPHYDPIASHAMFHGPDETPEKRAKNKVYSDMLKEHTKPENQGPCKTCEFK